MTEDLFLEELKDGMVLDVVYLRKNFIHKKKVKTVIEKFLDIKYYWNPSTLEEARAQQKSNHEKTNEGLRILRKELRL